MAAVTICSDFGAQENKACHCFHCFPIYGFPGGSEGKASARKVGDLGSGLDINLGASLMAQVVKNPVAMQEIQV